MTNIPSRFLNPTERIDHRVQWRCGESKRTSDRRKNKALFMALPASSVFLHPPNFQIRLSKNKPVQIHGCSLCCNSLHLYPRSWKEVRDARFRKRSKIKMHLSIDGERLWQAAPKPVKEFPWRKAGDLLLKRSLIIGQTTLKWSLIALFVCSSMSDVIFSISRNRELLIPVGLLAGCLMADFLKETLEELFPNSEGKGLNIPLVIISCLLVLVKAVSTSFAVGTQVLLLHVSNGGLLQVLWIWRNLLTENNVHNEDNVFTAQDAPLTASTEE